MEVTFSEVGRMLMQYLRAATSTRDKCQANPEPGYETRRAADVSHAQGRIDAVLVMQAKLAEMQAGAAAETILDPELFLASFESEAADARRRFAAGACGEFHLLFGKTEAYNDVTDTLQSWGHLSAVGL